MQEILPQAECNQDLAEAENPLLTREASISAETQSKNLCAQLMEYKRSGGWAAKHNIEAELALDVLVTSSRALESISVTPFLSKTLPHLRKEDRSRDTTA